MTVDKNTLTSKYFSLAKKLEKTYPNWQFRDHCYWRIALDNTLQGKWEKVIKRPAYKHLTDQQLAEVVSWMEQYEKDERLLQFHNSRSISFRKLVS